MFGIIYQYGAQLKTSKYVPRNLIQVTNAPPYISKLPHHGPPHLCKILEAANIFHFKFRNSLKNYSYLYVHSLFTNTYPWNPFLERRII